MKEFQKLLEGTHIVIIGDAVQRAVYKDLVLALKHNRLLERNELTSKVGCQIFCIAYAYTTTQLYCP